MTATTEAVTAARFLGTERLLELARTEFPGIDAALRDVNVGGAGYTEQRLIGSWHGVWLAFYECDTGLYVNPHAFCASCEMFTPVGHGGRTAAEFAARNRVDPPAAVDHCYACQWLVTAYAEALVATTAWKRRRFRWRRGESVESVIARYEALRS